jgi:hypothetical protein
VAAYGKALKRLKGKSWPHENRCDTPGPPARGWYGRQNASSSIHLSSPAPRSLIPGISGTPAPGTAGTATRWKSLASLNGTIPPFHAHHFSAHQAIVSSGRAPWTYFCVRGHECPPAYVALASNKRISKTLPHLHSHPRRRSAPWQTPGSIQPESRLNLDRRPANWWCSVRRSMMNACEWCLARAREAVCQGRYHSPGLRSRLATRYRVDENASDEPPAYWPGTPYMKEN